MRPASVLALLLLTAGCAHVTARAPDEVEVLQIGARAFRITYSPRDADVAQRVKLALRRAVPQVERWADFSATVEVRIHPDHAALAAATGIGDQPWVRAWTGYRSLDLQSPRSWSRCVSDADLERLVAHELTHCVMYQAAGSERTWAKRGIPLWFGEGMASVTAHEYRRSGYESIWRYYREHVHAESESAADPLVRPTSLVRSSSELVYGTAHHAFQFLVDQHGEERVRLVVAEMGEGHSFGEAFREVMGLTVAAFEESFKQHVLGQTWRG